MEEPHSEYWECCHFIHRQQPRKMFSSHDSHCVIKIVDDGKSPNSKCDPPSSSGENINFSLSNSSHQSNHNKMTFSVDETPTPSRYIGQQYTCEGLPFDEVCVSLNPFEEQFKRASQARTNISLESSSPHIPGMSPRYHDNGYDSSSVIRIDDDAESLDTPRIIPPSPVDSDQTISSTSRDDGSGYRQELCRTDPDCMEFPSSTHPHLKVSSSHLSVPSRHLPFRSLSELSARVSGRDDLDPHRTRRYDRQNTLDDDIEVDDIDCQPYYDTTSHYISRSVASESNPILSPDVVNDLSKKSAPPIHSERRTNGSSEERSGLEMEENVAERIEGRLIRRISAGGRSGHRLSINVTSAAEAGRSSSSVISTPTPVITAGPSVTQCHKDASVSSPAVIDSPMRDISCSKGGVETPLRDVSSPVSASSLHSSKSTRQSVVNAPHSNANAQSPIVLQLYVRFPNGQPMPLEIPASTLMPSEHQKNEQQTVPLNSTSTEAGNTSVHTSNSVHSSHTSGGTVMQPTSLAKMKLKAALTSNNSAANPLPKPPPSRALTAHRIATMTRSNAEDSIGTTSAQSIDSNFSSPYANEEEFSSRLLLSSSKGRKRSLAPPDEQGEKRQKFLERNRAAAVRCREKKKEWVTKLVSKSTELANVNSRLLAEMSSLRAENANLKSLLLRHSSCSVTLADGGNSEETESVSKSQRTRSLSASASTNVTNDHKNTNLIHPQVIPVSNGIQDTIKQTILPQQQGNITTIHQNTLLQIPQVTISTSSSNSNGLISFVPINSYPIPQVMMAPVPSILNRTIQPTLLPNYIVNNRVNNGAVQPNILPNTSRCNKITFDNISSKDQLTLNSLSSTIQAVQSSLTSSSRVFASLRTNSPLNNGGETSTCQMQVASKPIIVEPPQVAATSIAPALFHSNQSIPSTTYLLPQMSTMEEAPTTAAIIDDIAAIEDSNDTCANPLMKQITNDNPGALSEHSDSVASVVDENDTG